MPPVQLTRSGLGANSQAATSSSGDRRPRVVKRQTKPTTQRDVTGMLPARLQRQKFADWGRGQLRVVVAGLNAGHPAPRALPLAFHHPA